MRELIAGEGGSVLVFAAHAADAVALFCEGLAARAETPSGVPVFGELPDGIDIDRVRLLPCEAKTREQVRAWAASRGIDVVVDVPPRMSAPTRVISVTAASTGSGKTALTRRVARTLARSGIRVAVARHPIAGLLLWDRFDPQVVRTPPELAAPRPVEEREELAPVVGTGVPVVVGLDVERVLRLAANEADVIVWDGGGASPPCVETHLELLCVDLLRPRTVEADRVAQADVIVLCKADTAPKHQTRRVEEQVRDANPDASVLLADLAVGVAPVNMLADRRVVIVEDANSLLLGGLSAGAGAVAARRFRCGVVDPRPFAVGAVAEALRRYPHIGAVVPALGRTPREVEDLAASVESTPGDVVLWASNADPATVIAGEERPVVRAFGELTQVAGPPLQDLLLA